MIPVEVFSLQAKVKPFDSHMHHVGCKFAGAIGYKNYCKDCGEDVPSSEVVKLVDTQHGQISIEASEMKEALGVDEPSITLLHPIQQSVIPNLMQNGLITFDSIFQVRGMKQNKKPSKSVESMLRMLLDALSGNKQAFLVRIGLDVLRYGLLFPNGNIYTLLFDEEVHEDIPMFYEQNVGYDKAQGVNFKAYLKKKERALAGAITMVDLLDKVETLINSKKPIEVETVVKPVEANDLMASLSFDVAQKVSK